MSEQMRKVTLLEKTTTRNEYNELIESWNPSTKFTNGVMWVKWWDQGGKEALESGQIVAVKDVRIERSAISGLDQKTQHDYRIERDGVHYDIQSVKELGRSKQQMMLKARDNQ